MNTRDIIWVAVAIVAGTVIAVFLFMFRYRLFRRHVHAGRTDARETPPSAQPRYVGFGEYYDPYALWPYGPASNYQLFLATNSGVPASAVLSPGYRSAATAPASSLFGGNGLGR